MYRNKQASLLCAASKATDAAPRGRHFFDLLERGWFQPTKQAIELYTISRIFQEKRHIKIPRALAGAWRPRRPNRPTSTAPMMTMPCSQTMETLRALMAYGSPHAQAGLKTQTEVKKTASQSTVR